jgi:hypothetical protein
MSTGDHNPFITGVDGQTYAHNDAGLLVPLDIQTSQCTYAPRTIRANWTTEAVDDLKSMWGLGGPQYPDNALDRLNDALEDPNYDPDEPDYKGLPRWPDGRVASREEYLSYNPNERLVCDMAVEMTKEIDDEILRTLRGL